MIDTFGFFGFIALLFISIIAARSLKPSDTLRAVILGTVDAFVIAYLIMELNMKYHLLF